MPIYEYYSPDTNRIYSFYAKTLAQGRIVPRCPDHPRARMVKLVSGFAIGGQHKTEPATSSSLTEQSASLTDDRLAAAMTEMERDFSIVDENDPRAMARMLRRMADLSGESLGGPMEEAVRKLEEGADPDTLEEQLGDFFGESSSLGEVDFDSPMTDEKSNPKASRSHRKIRRPPPTRDPRLYDYD